ncbi:HNH endonuclease [Cellulosimicrobium sp. SJTW-1]|uniref:HNH endonuclease n=1 Tax=Cellulosimicrobium sp. SJTW-1 TaxID=3078082 RepID=UPI0039E89961
MVAALKDECRLKCIYCEGYVDDVSYIAVEHIAPKELFPERVLDWRNLGLACTRCNTNKGSYWAESDALRLINPYEDDPGDHLSHSGPLTVSVLGSSRGENTLRRLKFADRPDLLMSRMRRIQELDVRIRNWHAETDVEKKELLADDVRDAMAPDREFSAVLVAYAEFCGFLQEV